MEWKEIHNEFMKGRVESASIPPPPQPTYSEIAKQMRDNADALMEDINRYAATVQALLIKEITAHAAKVMKEAKENPYATESTWFRKEGRGAYFFEDDHGDLFGIQNLHSTNSEGKRRIALGYAPNSMYLTQDMVRALIPKLQEFVEQGEIS